MKKILISLVIILFNFTSFAQEDVAGSKDHPSLNRMPGYRIQRYKENEFNVYKDFKDANGKKINVEGQYYFIEYGIKKGEKKPSNAQIIRNYTNAVKQAGGTVVYEEGCCNAYLKLIKYKHVNWIRVQSYQRGVSYQLWIIEEAQMKQDIVIDAKSMYNDINSQGRVALYGIYFDFDKSEVKPESDPTLGQISKLLSENPSLNLYVVGHTDNVGDFNYNMKLSEARAEAVVKELISKYKIAKDRLTPAGVGPLCPVTSNDTEEGKAQNRRVELIKIK
jgi:outer membrane protein OmpA-like peptidoglycan-associated protein